jgi:hypothetical protein
MKRRMPRIATALAALALLLPASAASALEPRGAATLRALDKVKGASQDLTVKVGSTVSYGRLSITVRACWQAPPEDAPESAAFVEVRSKPGARSGLSGAVTRQPAAADNDDLFSGWMYASSPGLSALEHPTYDVWVISCSAS